MTASGNQTGKRRRALPMTAGQRAPVRAEDVDQLREMRAQLVRLRSRIQRQTDKIRAQMGPAEIGVDGQDVPIVRRRKSITGGGYVRMNHRDDLDITTPGEAR